MTGRARPGPPAPDDNTTSARLANLTARHDQARAVIEDHLRKHRGDKTLCDALLDVRLALDPLRPT